MEGIEGFSFFAILYNTEPIDRTDYNNVFFKSFYDVAIMTSITSSIYEVSKILI